MPSPEPLSDLSRLCLHTITTRPWPVEKAVEAYASAGVAGISIWRDAVENRKPEVVRRLVRDAGLSTVSYVRGGFFPSTSADARRRAIEENRRIVEEAHALGAPLVVLVCGADPDQSLEESRAQIRAGIEAVLSDAEAAQVKLGIEPLHPMYADTRSAVVTLAQANDMAGAIDSPFAGVVLDVYHVWWDSHLFDEIERCAHRNRLFAFHVCDWRVPTRDLLNDRGIMGEGCIPIRAIRAGVEAQGYKGFIEVEIFSDHYWQEDQDRYLQKIIEAYRSYT